MGVVGASAPMLFRVAGASTHTFWQLSPSLNFFLKKGTMCNSNFYDIDQSRHPQFQIADKGPEWSTTLSSMEVRNYCLFQKMSLKSHAWKYYLRDKKNGAAKCKTCQCILKSDQSTSTLHKIDVKSVENLEEPPSKKGKMESYFSLKQKSIKIQELVAKIAATDGTVSFACLQIFWIL